MINSIPFFVGGFVTFWVGILIFYYDLKFKTIPLYLLILFVILSCFAFITKLHNSSVSMTLEYFYSLFLVVLFIGVVWGVEKYKGHTLLGLGDKILLPCCALWLPLWIVPYFFMISGIIGCLTNFFKGRRKSHSRFPFAPALLLSLLICLFLCN